MVDNMKKGFGCRCYLVTCRRSVRLSACVHLGRGCRCTLSESEWLWGLMGLKKSVGTVSCWECSSGCDCTEPLEPTARAQNWQVNKTSQLSNSLRHLFISKDYQIEPCGCPAYVGVLVTDLRAAVEQENRGQRVAGGKTYSCRWAESGSVPLQAFWRSAGCLSVAPHN